MTQESAASHPLNVTAIIAGGGVGLRFGDPSGKQLAEIAGRPVLAWSTDAVARALTVSALIVVCDPERVEEYAAAVLPVLVTSKPVTFVPGGSTRQASVAAGLEAASGADVVVVHDGARPLIQPNVVDAAVQTLCDDPNLQGVVVGHPAIDTIKRVAGRDIVATPPRDTLWVAQTPQVFWRDALAAASEQADRDGYHGTDDSSILEHAGMRVAMVEGNRDNIKVTVSEDRQYVEHVLNTR